MISRVSRFAQRRVNASRYFDRGTGIHRNYSSVSDENTRTKVPFYLALLGFASGQPDGKNPNVEGISVVKQYFSRAGHTIKNFVSGFEEPAFDKLLPDPNPNDPHYKPLTLVVDLDKFLVYHIFDTELGKWRVAKRPGAEIFLFYMAQLYEVVVFSSLNQSEGDTIVRKLDPFGCITYHLFRFATHYKKGTYYKDIGLLNRDLSKVVVVGQDEKGFSMHSENVIVVPEWKGDPDDHTLEDLVDFFEALAFSKASDVRPMIQPYQHDIVEKFDKVQHGMYERLRKANSGNVSRKIQSAVYSVFGWEMPQDATPPYEEKKSKIRELRREEFVKAKDIMTNQLKIEMEKEKEKLGNQKMPFFDMLGKGPVQPPASN